MARQDPGQDTHENLPSTVVSVWIGFVACFLGVGARQMLSRTPGPGRVTVVKVCSLQPEATAQNHSSHTIPGMPRYSTALKLIEFDT